MPKKRKSREQAALESPTRKVVSKGDRDFESEEAFTQRQRERGTAKVEVRPTGTGRERNELIETDPFKREIQLQANVRESEQIREKAIQNELIKRQVASKGELPKVPTLEEIQAQQLLSVQQPSQIPKQPIAQAQQQDLTLGQRVLNSLNPMPSHFVDITGRETGMEIRGGVVPLAPVGAVQGIPSLPTAKTIFPKIAVNSASALKLSKGILKLTGLGIALSKIVQRQNVRTAATIAKGSQQNMAEIINGVNQGLLTPEEAVIAWSEELRNLNAAETSLRNLTNSFLDSFLSGGEEELKKIETFKRIPLQFYNQRLQQAFLQPNPNNFIQPLEEQPQELNTPLV